MCTFLFKGEGAVGWIREIGIDVYITDSVYKIDN